MSHSIIIIFFAEALEIVIQVAEHANDGMKDGVSDHWPIRNEYFHFSHDLYYTCYTCDILFPGQLFKIMGDTTFTCRPF